ncbi:P-loop containing nucleoside triphosphate hydrolase protein [Xylaria bambusicola]|uniref:P-loop containing nucleoside triphosphate hydrolase protein n=1 Tax=Xylaria bambusicola TaxID=326684 RepID=UPI002008B393|nr:P-loop containing nucleoside triphosphate hydrolase protein [Xylaria bambusicola]KAI0521504.1 P-loop containing nucleoside triphosphate hydrolase protein [Xylaria bambusicola]
MDVLKILSRGAKKTSSSQAFEFKPAPRVQNPQLYHDKGIKRKRDDQDLQFGRAHDDAEDSSLDFFASREPKQSKPTAQPTVTEEQPKDIPKTEPSLLDDDEVRQVLRSHRLKFTLLSHHEDRKAKITKSKKKKKDVSTVKAKDAKKALFPQPLVSFTQLRATWKLSPRLEDNLADQGYRIPTEVQLGSLPALIRPGRAISTTAAAELGIEPEDGIHFLAVAPTGSGKTLAFLIPAINDVLRRRAEVTKDRVLETIVVVPTRELAEQITNEGRKLTKNTGVKIVMMKRGMRLPAEGRMESEDNEVSNSESEESSDSSDGSDSDENDQAKETTLTRADILITTPLLLGNFLKSRTLPTVRSLILDEGDVLLEQRFLEQTLQIWSACINPSLRLRCFSATMGAHIEELISNQLSKRDRDNRVVPLVRLVVGLKDTAVPSIGHKLVYCATEQGKLFALRQILHPQSSSASVPDMNLPILVFTQTIERATALHNELKFDFPVEAGGPSRIAALHSSLSDSARSDIVRRFRSGEIWALVTTDLLMRGLDFRGVSGVVNYDVPTSAAAYVHRVGRTGRAGQPGIACTFYTNDDIPYLKSIANVISQSEKQAGKTDDGGVPKWLLESLPKISKEEKKKLKQRGIESRRGNANKITTKSAWERRKENNRREAIASSKKRKLEGPNDDTQDQKSMDEEWGGLDD